MRPTIATLLIAMALVPPSHADGPEPGPTYTVLRATAPVLADGLLDETDWTMAQPMTGIWQPRTDGRAQSAGAEVKFLWDDAGLHVGAWCPDDAISPGDVVVLMVGAATFEIEPIAIVGDGWAAEAFIPWSAIEQRTARLRPGDGDAWPSIVKLAYSGTYAQWGGPGVSTFRLDVPAEAGRLAFSGRSVREDRWTPPEYTIHRAPGAVTIDGRADEAAWQTAEVAGPFVYPWWDRTRGPRQDTTARLLWDDEYLYATWTCEDRYIMSQYARDDDPVWIDDCAEVFIAPDPERLGSYLGFEINCRGLCLDYHRRTQADPGFAWDAEGLRIATSIDGTWNDNSDIDRGWTVEAAIPMHCFASLTGKPTPAAGDAWRLNFNRLGGTIEQQFGQWCPSDWPAPHFHRPQRFGVAVFAE